LLPGIFNSCSHILNFLILLLLKLAMEPFPLCSLGLFNLPELSVFSMLWILWKAAPIPLWSEAIQASYISFESAWSM
jgi:hypothetical protein